MTKPRLILLLALLLTIAIYWPGLSGPFLFDDNWNLEPLRLWHAGQASWQEVVFPQASFVFSRPVAMASFMLSTVLFGPESFSFKLGNLIVHLACGILAWAVMRRVLVRDARLATHAELLAALIAAFWLLHPLHVSTVLYVVQRMAQLSTLFTLAAVWVYLVARQQLIEGRDRTAWLNLFVAFPVFVLLGVLSKQNAAIAPALCLVLELAYFNRQTRPCRCVHAFFGIFLALPMLGAVALLAFSPQRLLAGYAEWDFTLWERLLTQPRVLMEYIGMLLIPRGPQMGLYTDDFVVSQGLLSPVSTLLSILALIGLSVAAIAVRKRAPSVMAGWFFFLVAHSVESTFLPLEMYYEHRNYLPSLGLLLAAFGLIALVPAFKTNTLSPRKLGLIAATGFALILGIATFGRVLIWQDNNGIVQQALLHHPDSVRLRFDIAAKALERGDFEAALAEMQHVAANGSPRDRQLGKLGAFTVKCLRKDQDISVQELEQAVAANLPRLTTYEAQSIMRLSRTSRTAGCGDMKIEVIAGYLTRMLDSASSQPETAQPKWYSRSMVAEMYAHVGAWADAQAQAEAAWEGSHNDPRVGALLTSIYIKTGDLAAAQVVLSQLEKSIKPSDVGGQGALDRLRKQLAAAATQAN